ncbi:MAG: hypothetical protein SF051_12350 [Elusimicrobiota bacterium]|nr:hypothetical protein [Elusimicrobiota bacterium]
MRLVLALWSICLAASLGASGRPAPERAAAQGSRPSLSRAHGRAGRGATLGADDTRAAPEKTALTRRRASSRLLRHPAPAPGPSVAPRSEWAGFAPRADRRSARRLHAHAGSRAPPVPAA